MDRVPVTPPFRARVEAALAAPLDGPLRTRFVAPLVTALVARAEEGPELADALAAVSEALARVGVPTGRQYVLLAGRDAARRGEERARALRVQLGLPVLLHAPERAGFIAGRLGVQGAIELDDELREAEGIVTLASMPAGAGGAWSAASVLCPDACSMATRERFAQACSGEPAADWALLRHCEREVPHDLVVWWEPGGVVHAASGAHAFAHWAAQAGQ